MVKNWIFILGVLLILLGVERHVLAQPLETGYNNSFVTPIELPISGAQSAPVGVFVEDIDQNGEKDILLIREAASRIYYQTDGVFTPTIIDNPLVGFTRLNLFRDFNQDGIKDYLATDYSYLLSNGSGYTKLTVDYFRSSANLNTVITPSQTMYFYSNNVLYSAHLISTNNNIDNPYSNFQYIPGRTYFSMFNLSDPSKLGIEQQIYSFPTTTSLMLNRIADDVNQEFIPELFSFESAFGPIVYNNLFTSYTFSESEFFKPNLPSKPIDLRKSLFEFSFIVLKGPRRVDVDSDGNPELLLRNQLYNTQAPTIPALSDNFLSSAATLRDMDVDGNVDYIEFYDDTNFDSSILSFYEYESSSKKFEKQSTVAVKSSFPKVAKNAGIPDIAVNGTEVTFLSDKRYRVSGILASQGFEAKSLQLVDDQLVGTGKYEVQEVYSGTGIFSFQPIINPFRLTLDDVNGDGIKDLVIATAGMTGGKQAPQVVQIYLSPQDPLIQGTSFFLY